MEKRDGLRILKSIKPRDAIYLKTKEIIFRNYHGHFVFYHGIDDKGEGILVSFRYNTDSRTKIHFDLIKTFRKASQQDLVLGIHNLRGILADLQKQLNEWEKT